VEGYCFVSEWLVSGEVLGCYQLLVVINVVYILVFDICVIDWM